MLITQSSVVLLDHNNLQADLICVCLDIDRYDTICVLFCIMYHSYVFAYQFNCIDNGGFPLYMLCMFSLSFASISIIVMTMTALCCDDEAESEECRSCVLIFSFFLQSVHLVVRLLKCNMALTFILRKHGCQDCQIVRLLTSVMSLSLVPWRLVIGRLGHIGHGELRGWSTLLSRKSLKKAIKQLKVNYVTVI